jgi:hypothetical protein
MSMRAGVLVLVAVVVAGCGGPARPVMVPVSGAVQYDGQPVAEGSVTFVAPDGSSVPNVLTIADGRYAGQVVAGEKRLEVRGLRRAKVPAAAAGGPGSEDGTTLENYIPAAYNDQSTLVREIMPPGPTVIDLELDAAP